MAGFGLFDMASLALSIGATPVLTLNADPAITLTSDLADLIEYCHGNADTTAWGKLREADTGSKVPLNVTYFELGNEMYNANFLSQVKAMEVRANDVGVRGKLNYIFPDNHGPNRTDSAAISALNLGKRIIVDTHHWFGTATDWPRPAEQASFGVMNLETNYGSLVAPSLPFSLLFSSLLMVLAFLFYFYKKRNRWHGPLLPHSCLTFFPHFCSPRYMAVNAATTRPYNMFVDVYRHR